MKNSFVDWELAKRVAVRVAGREPYTLSFHRRGLVDDFTRFTSQAEELVGDCTGLRSQSGLARSRLIGRSGWIDANIASFKRLLRPLTEKLSDRLDSPAAPVTRRLAGAEFGFVLGWMSTRVLGQYDLLVIEDEQPDEQDIVYYVAPNVLTMENRYAFDSSQFRLWLALHEVTHRAQFTGVSWLRAHFLSLVESVVEGLAPDPKRFSEALRRVVNARRRGEDPLASGGIAALFATETQAEVLDQLYGLMALLEGHGDVTMARAGRGLLPGADRFARVMRSRRRSVRGFVKLVQKLVGIDAKISQYAAGENFIELVELTGGSELLNRVWTAPEYLPNKSEIVDPQLWVNRVSSHGSVVASR
ncbi:MAG: zinc-dependent metalloprotease [Acidimicrobiaceae bacterium]|nr:zinc-dependent metalloprotease [Acidimicrobiaceae bacterium]